MDSSTGRNTLFLFLILLNTYQCNGSSTYTLLRENEYLSYIIHSLTNWLSNKQKKDEEPNSFIGIRGGICITQSKKETLSGTENSSCEEDSNEVQDSTQKSTFTQKVKAVFNLSKFLCTVSGAFLFVAARYSQKTRKEKNIFWRWYHQWQKERTKEIARRSFGELLRSPDHTMDLKKLKYVLESDQEARRFCPTCTMQNKENQFIIQQKINRIKKKRRKDRSLAEHNTLEMLQRDLKYKEKHFSLESRHSYYSSWIRSTTGGEYLCIESETQRNQPKYKNIQRTDWQYHDEADWVLLFLKAGVTLDKEAFQLLCEYYTDRLKVARRNTGYANSIPAYILYTVPESEKREEFIMYLLQQNLDPFFLHTLSFGPPDRERYNNDPYFVHPNQCWWEARWWEITKVVASYFEHMLDSYPYDLNKTFLELFQEHIGMEIPKNQSKSYSKYRGFKIYDDIYPDRHYGRFLQTSILYNIVSSAYFDPDAAILVVQRLLARRSDPNKRTGKQSKNPHKKIPSFFVKLLSGTSEILDYKDFHYNEQCKNNINRFLKSRIALTQLFLHYGVQIPSYYEEEGLTYYNRCQKVLEDDNASAVKKIVAEQYKSTIIQIVDLIKEEQEFREQFLKIDLFAIEKQKTLFDHFIKTYPRPDLWLKRVGQQCDVFVYKNVLEEGAKLFIAKLTDLLVGQWDDSKCKSLERIQTVLPLLMEGEQKRFLVRDIELFYQLMTKIADEGYYEKQIYQTLSPMFNSSLTLITKINQFIPKVLEHRILQKSGKNLFHSYARKGFDNERLARIIDRMKNTRPLQLLSMLFQKESAPEKFRNEEYTPIDLARYYSFDVNSGRNREISAALKIMKQGIQDCLEFYTKNDLIFPREFEIKIHEAKKLFQAFSLREAI